MAEFQHKEFDHPLTVTGVDVPSDENLSRMVVTVYLLRASDFKDLKQRGNSVLDAGKYIIFMGAAALATFCLQSLTEPDCVAYFLDKWAVWTVMLIIICCGFVVCLAGAYWWKSPYKTKMKEIEAYFKKHNEV